MERTQPRTRRAEVRITVHSYEAEPYDQTVSPALVVVRLSETFTSTRRSICEPYQHATISRKTGAREGSFVLQGSEIVANCKITATWFVVPGWGTGDLSGLRGVGGFEGYFGKGSQGTLHYWFE